MMQIRKSVLVLHTARQMFDLVDAVERYPDFLPWCSGSKVHVRDAEWTVATLGIEYLGLSTSFTTENRKSENAIALELKDGPFHELSGAWRFKALNEEACKVEFELDYTFSSRALETVVGPVFNVIASTFVDAFTKQADREYGA